MTYTNNTLTRLHLDPVSPFDQTETLVLPDALVQAASAQPRTRQTFHVNVEQCPNPALLKATLHAWQPSAVLLLGNKNAPNGLARELMAQVAAWNGIGIYRPFENREGDIWTQRTPRQHVDWLLSMALPENCWVNVGNEPVPNEDTARNKMSPWYAEFVDLAVAAGLNVVIPGGFASGAFSQHAINGGWFDGMLRAIGKHADKRHRGYGRVMLGAHTYGHGLVPWHTAGRDVNLLMNREAIQKAHWPTKAEIFDGDESNNWLILRENWLLNRLRKLTDNPALVVDVAITEAWWDRMPNIVQQYPQVAAFMDGKAGREIRGLPTVRGYLAWAFPQWTFAQAVCEQLAWTERVYPPHYRAFVNFAWTDNALWKAQYDWSGLTDVLEAWPMFAVPLDPEPEENPIPPGFEEYILSGNSNMKLRDKPVTGLVKFTVPVGARLHVAKAGITKPDGQALEWVEVIHTYTPAVGEPKTYRGWMGILSTFDAQFDPLPPVEEPPVPPKEPDPEPEPTPTPTYVTLAQLDAALIAQDARWQNRLEALKAELATYIDAALPTVQARTINEIVRRLLETKVELKESA